MKVLLISDTEQSVLWDHWSHAGAKRLEGVQLILSAGDLKPAYLEFLVTMANVPLLYVRGNHDTIYDEKPPRGCTRIDDKLVKVIEDTKTGDVYFTENYRLDTRFRGDEFRAYTIAGLGGSMRYNKGDDMFTEEEMAVRVRKLGRKLRLAGIGDKYINRRNVATDETDDAVGRNAVDLDILLTHAPSFGHGDMDDLAHRGFDSFNKLMEDFRVGYHCYGHVHREYGRIERVMEHPTGTTLVNCSDMYIIEI